MRKYVEVLHFPNEWWELKLTLATFMLQAYEKKIGFDVKNDLHEWDKLGISQLEFSSLIGNLLSNSLKELDKVTLKGKQIVVRFYKNKGGICIFEIADNAHEFAVDVLRRLGERKNSTNGTGDGYAEIFEVIEKVKASFMIEEVFVMGYVNKKIIISFNGLGEVRIKSNYRQEVLDTVLVDSLKFYK